MTDVLSAHDIKLPCGMNGGPLLFVGRRTGTINGRRAEWNVCFFVFVCTSVRAAFAWFVPAQARPCGP